MIVWIFLRLYMLSPFLLVVLVYKSYKNIKRRVSSMLSLIICIIIFTWFWKHAQGYEALLWIFYPLICLIIWALLFGIEKFTWFLKNKGFHWWWVVPVGCIVLVLAYCWHYWNKNYNKRFGVSNNFEIQPTSQHVAIAYFFNQGELK